MPFWDEWTQWVSGQGEKASLSAVRLYLELGVPTWQPHRETMQGWTAPEKSCLAPPVSSPPGDSWPSPGSWLRTLLSHPLPLGSQDFNPTSAQTSVWRSFRPDFSLLTEFWCQDRVLVLAGLSFYHSLKLSYLLPYYLPSPSGMQAQWGPGLRHSCILVPQIEPA